MPTLEEHLVEETKLKAVALHVGVAYATSVEAKRRGEIDDFVIVVDSDGSVTSKVIRR